MTPVHTKSAVLVSAFTTNTLAMVTSEHISTAFQFGTMLGIVVIALMNRLDARKALAVANATKDTTDKIHVLSNSAMEAQMRVVWLQAKRIADMSRKKEDRKIADEAERIYNEHVVKQKVVDAGTKK